MKKYCLPFGVSISFLVPMNSCDTREDYFSEFGEAPTITINENGNISHDKYRYIQLHWGETKTVNLLLTDYYGCDFTYKLETYIPTRGLSEKNYIEEPYYFNGKIAVNNDSQNYSLDEFNNLKIDIEPGEKIDGNTKAVLTFKELTNNGILDYLNYNPETNWTTMESAHLRQLNIKLIAKNSLGAESYFNFFLQIIPNSQPIANFSYSKLEGDNYDYTITAFGADADDDDIVMYEYLFDGKAIEHENKIKYYSVFPTLKDSKLIWSKSPNKDLYLEETALYGELIAPTKHSSVKHSFNKTGVHSVAVRCQDSKGCWSKWRSQTIEIK